jgi:hypothetical protein
MQLSTEEVQKIKEQINWHGTIDEELLARCLHGNDWFYKSSFNALPGQVNWGEQATNLLHMRVQGMTLEKCAKHFGVTRVRIQQVQFRALRRLRTLASQQHFTVGGR